MQRVGLAASSLRNSPERAFTSLSQLRGMCRSYLGVSRERARRCNAFNGDVMLSLSGSFRPGPE